MTYRQRLSYARKALRDLRKWRGYVTGDDLVRLAGDWTDGTDRLRLVNDLRKAVP